MPENTSWRVCFDGGFRHPQGRAGTEMCLDRQLVWNDRALQIPSVYLCGRGLVVDVLTRVRAETLRAFYEKWSLSPEKDGSALSEAEWAQCSAENPLSGDFSLRLRANGKALPSAGSSSLVWNPVFPEKDDAMCAALRHYGLDPAHGWLLHRFRFAWVTRRRPLLRTLDAVFSAPVETVCTAPFSVRAGESVALTHPISGEIYTLHAKALTQQTMEIPREVALSGALEVPNRCWRLAYTVVPELPAHSAHLRDVCPPDAPHLNAGGFAASADDDSAASIGIIGGSDGPTAIFLSTKKEDSCSLAFSSLSFAPREAPTWQLHFRHRPCADLALRLYGENGLQKKSRNSDENA